ncbi:MAG TPA: dihydropteroate synthase [Stellaceae bacterium]|nr:dihydropteroate synthase [Stellaceae bacterium]
MTRSGLTAVTLEEIGAEAQSAWLAPTGLVAGAAAARAIASGVALPLAGATRAFVAVELLARREGRTLAAPTSIARLRAFAHARGPATSRHIEARLAALSAPRPDWAGLSLARPLIMGIINVTPDSFSDGGKFLAPDEAAAHGRALLDAGADILDVGGESTRPGATPVSPEEEMRRIAPVLRALVATGAPVSVDTRHAATMTMALEAGARIVNDVSALAGPGSMAAVARAGAAVVLMHMQGEPATMQRAPVYRFAPVDVLEELAARVAACEAAGIPRARIAIDPGIGFGKTAEHNLEILAGLPLFQALGTGVMVGLSRKSFVGRLAGGGGGAATETRLAGSLAGALDAVSKGAQIVRVHDVAETRRALAFQAAIEDA